MRVQDTIRAASLWKSLPSGTVNNTFAAHGLEIVEVFLVDMCFGVMWAYMHKCTCFQVHYHDLYSARALLMCITIIGC